MGRGIAHVTTRQDIQIHWVPVEEIMAMYDRLLAVDITTRGACADTVRNVTACPYAGVAPDEPFDVAPYCLAVHDYFLFNPLNLTLPRKFKIALEGCHRDCAQLPINDIGVYASCGRPARLAVGRRGLGSQPFAIPVRDFLPAADLPSGEAIVRSAPARRAQEPQPRPHEVRREEDGRRQAGPPSRRRWRASRLKRAELRREVQHWVEAYAVPLRAAPATPRPSGHIRRVAAPTSSRSGRRAT